MDLLQASIELGFAFITLTDNRSFALSRLEVSIRTGCPEGVVGQASGHKQEPCQKDGGQCHCVNDPVTDARDDFEERAFPGGACSHGFGESVE